MEAPVGEVNLSRLERVISGPGKIEALANELDRRNLKRAIVVTGKTLGKSPLLPPLKAPVFGSFGFHTGRKPNDWFQLGSSEQTRGVSPHEHLI